jgi:sugar phosphate isomerase/epimerase
MRNDASRRQFLGAGLAGAVCLGLMPTFPALACSNPIQRTDKYHFKLSLAAYSLRESMTQNWPKPKGNEGKMTLLDFLDQCAAWNLDACELTSYYFPKEITTEYLNQVKEKTFRLGLDISGTAIGNNFCLKDTKERTEQIEMTQQWVDYAAIIGAPVIRIFAGYIPKGDTEEEAVSRCVEAINEVVPYAEKKGVILALENHGGITSTPEQLMTLLQRAKESPYLGVNFDSGNFKTSDPYGDLEKIAPYAYNAQIKVEISPNNKVEPTDIGRVVKILKDAKYRGYIVLEYEAKEDPYVAIPRYLEQLRAQFA